MEDFKNASEYTIQDVKKMVDEAESALSTVRDRIKTDIHFSSGISSQWLDEDDRVRGESRAKFQFPLFSSYISKITGAYAANPYGIKIERTEKKAEEPKGLEEIQDIISKIEQRSNAKHIYQSSLRNALACGYGYIFVTTCEDKEGKEYIELESVQNPLSILFDPCSEKVDGSDAEYAVHKEDVSKEKALRIYPKLEEENIMDGVMWNSRTDISVPIVTVWKMNDKGKVDIIKTVGNQIVNKATLDIDRLPIVPVHGEVVLKTDNGAVTYTGIVHKAIDAQRLLNYANSLSAERLALSPKANYLTPADAIKEHKKIWRKANQLNVPALPYDQYDSKGRTLNAPQKQDTSINIGDISNLNQLFSDSVANIIGIPLEGIIENHSVQTAEEVITKAKASESILSTYYENLASSVKAVGELLVQLVPQVYDVPEVGSYEITVTSGPLLATLRKEKLRNYMAIAAVMPEYKPILAPQMLECMDGVDEELVEQAKAISVMQLKQMANSVEASGQNQGQPGEQSPDVTQLLNENAALQNQLQELQAKMQNMELQWNEKRAELEADVYLENLKHQHALELEAMKQEGATNREDAKLMADAKKTAFEAEQEMKQTLAQDLY